MPSSAKNERRLTGYRGDGNTQNNVGQIQHQSLYDDDDVDNYQQYQATAANDNYEEYDEDVDDGHGDERDDAGSELSIPDANIDFDLVYALHTFAATVEGQASVVRGDALTLLDDSNSYWWLVKVLKSAEVGYIPAENIETPHERLARLNSHRNIELTKKDIQDTFPKPPSNKPKNAKRVTLAKGVQFQSQIIYGSSDDEEDFEAEFQLWNERMQSDESDLESNESEDPYQYYGESQNAYYSDAPQHADAYASYNSQDYNKKQGYNQQRPNKNVYDGVPGEEEPIDYYQDEHMSGDSDIINDPEDQMMRNSNRDTMSLEDETIKISLTPSIARDRGNNRRSDSDIQAKIKKAAKLEKLLGGSSPSPELQTGKQGKEKKEKTGIRKFFSRNGKEGKKGKKNGELERKPSDGSSITETASVSSQSTGMMSYEHERSGSLDSTVQPTRLKVYAGNTDFGHDLSKYALVYPSTTALELIHQLVSIEQDDEHLLDDNAYQDYYIVVRTSSGDEFTLVPSDKPLEIFASLTSHLNTPMPSLRKARRISQLMGSEASHIGGPKDSTPITSEDEVQFYLFSKTRRVDEGEIQIKVSHLPSDQAGINQRVDKLVKISASSTVKDAVTILLEKFHILNGVVADINTHADNVRSLRLDGDDVVDYGLSVVLDGVEYSLNLDVLIIQVFGENVPHIQYRRSSNPDRSSITVNITPPDNTETYFILKPILPAKPPQKDIWNDESILEPNFEMTTLESASNQNQYITEHPGQEYHETQDNQTHDTPKRRLARQDTPMPRQEDTPTDGFKPPEEIQSEYNPKLFIETSRSITDSPEENQPENDLGNLTSLSSTEDILTQLDAAIDTLNLNRHFNPNGPPQPTPQTSIQQQISQPVQEVPVEQQNQIQQKQAQQQPIQQQSAQQPVQQQPVQQQSASSQAQQSTDQLNSMKPTQPKPARPQINTEPTRQSSTRQIPTSPQRPAKQKRGRAEAAESMLFANDFGMNELMVIIRGAAQNEKIKSKVSYGRHTSYNIRSEISEVFKDSQTRLDQLEKELDRIMAEAIKVYD